MDRSEKLCTTIETEGKRKAKGNKIHKQRQS